MTSSPFSQVYLYGAQVTSWKNDHAEELLFVSSKVHSHFLKDLIANSCMTKLCQ